MYYFLYGLLYLLSLLPLRLLYLLSDVGYFFLYYVIGYRKNIVYKNLTIAFPEKNKAEKVIIAKQFYHNFTDTFIETIKLVSAGKDFIKKHFTGDLHLLDELYHKGKRVQVQIGHNFNWELANIGLPFFIKYKMLAVYMPIVTPALDRLLLKIRSKNGSVMISATKFRNAILPYRNQQYLLAIIADQNPGIPSQAYWVNFFGKPTPFVKGPEKNARANDAAVVFAQMTKTRRGVYRFELTLATENPLTLPEAELTAIYIKYLENVIKQNPEMWLWSHRRWKHEWKPEYGAIIGK